MSELNLKNRVLVSFDVEVITGLHIGGSKDVYGIGGIDSPVIKNPLNNQPIIPGSSLKGKMRLLLDAVGTSQELMTRAFGPIPKDKDTINPMSRLVFRDLSLSTESANDLQQALGSGFFTEVKAENTIDRVECKSNPRFIERVPSGAVFTGDIVINVVNEDDEQRLVDLVKKGFELIENNFIGGSGSRGYGKVKFLNVTYKNI